MATAQAILVTRPYWAKALNGILDSPISLVASHDISRRTQTYIMHCFLYETCKEAGSDTSEAAAQWNSGFIDTPPMHGSQQVPRS
mmetsp:Transcript_37038/g.69064  ORF Transcript_37038/g.69064 Transcript_37038/m.69064 type:complete len:85 (+) Transcript_37038:22-276(+)